MKGERDLVPALVSLACGEGTERRQTEVQPRGWKRGPACTSGKLGRGGNIGSEIRRAGEISVMKTSRGEALSSQTLRKGTEVENVRRLLLYAQENEEKSGLKGETCVTLWGVSLPGWERILHSRRPRVGYAGLGPAGVPQRCTGQHWQVSERGLHSWLPAPAPQSPP